ncbi:MAG: hypothetical protein U9N54_12625 [candidate division Zixibacteria bacterium]|nr:hypothetical protein [candidate division Zixibacteria bacterium]
MKFYKVLFYIFITIIMCKTTFSEDNIFNNDYFNSINSADNAIKTALKFTGFENYNKIDIDHLKEMTTITKFIDSTTPFLSEQMNGRRVWKISLKDIYLKPEEQIGKNNYNSRDFEIFIDSATGQFLEMRSFDANIDQFMYPEIPSKIANEQMNLFQEKYLGIPKVYPKINFLSALKAVKNNVELTKLMVVKYIIYSIREEPSINAWIIHLHGIPENSIGITHKRYVVDADNGIEIHSVNWPSPTKEYLKKIGWDKNK